MTIFGHVDSDGHSIELLAKSGDPQEDMLLLYRHRWGSIGSVRIDREAALRLYNALGEYLYPVHRAEAPNGSLIEDLIAKAVKDQVAAILPLHLSPVAYVPEPDAEDGWQRSEPEQAPSHCGECSHPWQAHTLGVCWSEVKSSSHRPFKVYCNCTEGEDK